MRQPNLTRLWVCFGLLLAVPACGAAETLDDPGPFRSGTGKLEVWFPELSFSRGKNEVELCVIERKTGDAVLGLEMEMVPFMPSMGHGSSGPSSSTELDGGCYEFQGVVLNMPGTWELRTQIRGIFEDSAAPTLFVR